MVAAAALIEAIDVPLLAIELRPALHAHHLVRGGVRVKVRVRVSVGVRVGVRVRVRVRVTVEVTFILPGTGMFCPRGQAQGVLVIFA